MEQFVAALKGQDTEAFEVLFHTYYAQLVRFAEGILFDPQQAEDTVQALFVYLWENPEKANITTSAKAYLYRAVHNRCLNQIKSIRVLDKNLLLYQQALINSGQPDVALYPEKENRLRQALSQLPERMAKIFQMKYLEEKKLKDIADHMGISENTVKTQLLRAKEKLRKMLTVILWYILVP